jgi:NADH:ubiquinone oxidoreductase subunit 6 (subunit J)
MITPVHIIFLIIAAVTLASAIMVVSTQRIMHAALWLVLTLFGVAVLFAMLETRFFVVVQVIVYIGAIAILIIFAVMLTRRIMQDDSPQLNKTWWIAALIALFFFVAVVVMMSGWEPFSSQTRTVASGGENLMLLGKAFVDPNAYMIPFEVASILLLAALIGAVFIAGERKGGQE